jgi:2-iminobutanoate/2-iminopropanoate deaminase
VSRRVIRTDNAPAPFQGAPYSQGIAHGGLVFVSGQLGVDPGGNMVEGGIADQTEQVMKNLSAILEAAGTSLGNVVKASIFLADLGDFQGMNEVYGRYMGDEPPARATVQVGALPSGALVEIEVIAAATATS